MVRDLAILPAACQYVARRICIKTRGAPPNGSHLPPFVARVAALPLRFDGGVVVLPKPGGKRGHGKRGQEKNIDKISQTQSLPEAGITAGVDTLSDSDINPTTLTYPDCRGLKISAAAPGPN